MKNLTLINKKIWERKKKYFENIEYYGKRIKEEAEKILGPCKVLIFGSVIKGNFGPQSDIDVLIISEKLSLSWEENRIIRTKIKSKVDPFAPFQIHLARPEEFESWYKKFIKDDFKEIF